jgi:threonine dehydrogenase-like Zn-dependent dehydrogenase
MKALVYTAPEKMEMLDVPDPEVRAGEVLLKVSAAGICGSDIHGFLGHSERRKPGLVLGHEAVATVAELGPEVKGWRSGQRVSFNPLVSCGACAACLAGRQNVCATWRLFGLDRVHGTYAPFVAVPACQLHVLSEGLPEAEAILVEPLAVVVHAFRIALQEPPRSLAIVGAGPIGILSLVLAKLRGVPKVAVSDVSDERLATAHTLGADLVVNAAREDAPEAVHAFIGGGAECVVEAVGTTRTRRDSVRAAARGARLLFLGIAENDSPLPWIEMTRNEQTVITSFAYAPRDFADAVTLIEARPFDLKPWTEARPLEEGQAAFLRMAHRPGATLKHLLQV